MSGNSVDSGNLSKASGSGSASDASVHSSQNKKRKTSISNTVSPTGQKIYDFHAASSQLMSHYHQITYNVKDNKQAIQKLGSLDTIIESLKASRESLIEKLKDIEKQFPNPNYQSPKKRKRSPIDKSVPQNNVSTEEIIEAFKRACLNIIQRTANIVSQSEPSTYHIQRLKDVKSTYDAHVFLLTAAMGKIEKMLAPKNMDPFNFLGNFNSPSNPTSSSAKPK
ncbi:uncharacterized protein LOC116337954 [Contarinia nasturtii]|uniref:uncharacterized protein LOC116337954 n=1 Tax=Contarinia nasturtii TaxID=265458 RepID=UPI0012D3B70B|nr:uncharacterized protein LOC116337954 [Contarinia nasturtii]